MIVGSAKVRISPDTTGFAASLRTALEGSRAAAAAAGRSAGDAFSREFDKSISDSMRNVSRNMRGVGSDIGRSIGTPMQAEIQNMADQAFDNVAKNAPRQGASAGSAHAGGIKSGASRALRGWNPFDGVDRDAGRAGERTARGFTDRFNTVLSSGIGQAALAASRGFTLFFAKAQTGAVALSSLGGVISSLVSGLYLVGTAAASAGASLAALGGMAGVAIQGGIALGVAFKGVGKAIGAGMKEASGGAAGAGNAAVAAARRVADARARIQETQIANARKLVDAENKIKDARQRLNEVTAQGDARVADSRRKVAGAEQKLAEATDKVTAAQKRLSDAQREGMEYLQQLAFDSEDAVLAQEAAAIALEKAQARAQQARDVAPEGSRARQEIELALKEAELAMRRANDRVNDLAEEQVKAAEGGIEGTKAVTDATNAVTEAINDERDAVVALEDARKDADDVAAKAAADRKKAEDALADARSDKARVEQDNARDLAKARLDLARAIEDQSKATAGASSAVNAYQDALDKLSPSAQEFVKRLVGMKDRFNEFKKAVQEPFFAAFNEPFFKMVDTLLPAAETGLAKTSGLVGTMAAQFAGALTDNLDNFNRLLEFNNKILGIFAKENENGQSMMSKLVDLFFRFGQAIEPITERFANFIVHLVDLAHAATDTEGEMTKFTDFFNRAGDRMSMFGSIFGHIIDLFGTLSKAAGPAVDTLLKYFDDAFAGMNASAESNIGAIGNFFNGVVNNLMPLFDLLGQVSLIFLEMGASPKLGEAIEILKGGVEPLRKIVGEGNNVMPVLAEIVVNILRVFAALSQSGAIESFFAVFKEISGRIATLFEGEAFQSILKAVGPIMGLVSAFSVLSIGAQAVGSIILGKFLGPIKMIMGVFGPLITRFSTTFGYVGQLGGGIKGLASAFRIFLGPVGIVLTVLAILVPMLIKLYNENEKVRAAFDSLFAAVGKLAGTLMEALGPVIDMLVETFTMLLDAIMPVVAELLTALLPVIETLVNVIGDVLVPIIQEMLKIVLPIIQQIIKVLISILVPAIELVVEAVKIWARFFQAYVTTMFDTLKTIWERVGKPVFEFIGKMITGIVDIITSIVSSVATAFSSVWGSVTSAYNQHLAPTMTTIGNAFTNIPKIIDGIITGVRDAFSRVWKTIESVWTEHLEPLIDTISGAFAAIPDAIEGAFNGLRNALKTPLNVGIDLINDATGGINNITKPFGIPAIGKIARLATGGYINGPGGPTDDRVPAWLSSGEYVVKAATVKALGGKEGMDAINAGLIPRGGWDPADLIKDGAKALAGAAGKALVNGVSAVVKPLWDGTLGKYGEHLRGDGTFVGSLLGGFLRKLEDVFFDKVDAANKKQEEVKNASASGGGSVTPYDGPPGGWTYPLTRRFPGRNWSGHSPANAIDISSPTGIGVRAASAGIVYVLADAGNRSYGKHIKISHAGGMRTVYAHLSRFATSRGARVSTGQLIGYSGNTGGSSGPHLHFELNPSSSTIGAMRSRGVALATGGVVRATPGGVMAMLAEGGKHERVEPLDSRGLSARDYAMIEAVAKRAGGGVGGNVTMVRVYIGEKELTDMIKYEVTDSQTTMARNLSTGRRSY